ncbi:MAG: hypothetical protein LQ341_004780 [Variospora aurantia]|nr:MAG: hypothetical protein LQ341_004780 [Variospora aurantia]
MLRFLTALALIALITLYAAQKSYVAILSLLKYEERSEKAAKHSDTAARELYKSKATQQSSAAAIALSLASSLALSSAVLLLGSPSASTSTSVLPPVNIVAIAAAFVHNRSFWKAKAKVPFVGGFNEAIQKSKEIRQLMVPIALCWGLVGLLCWIDG